MSDRAPARGSEHGDRAAFLALVGRGAPVGGVPPGPHPPPPPPAHVPEVRYRSLDGYDHAPPLALLPVFTAAATAADARVHAPSPAGLRGVVAELVRIHRVETAVVTREPEAQALVQMLLDAGVAVTDHSPAAAVTADLGVTGAIAGVAATGSVVLDADRAGGRGAGLLPRVHVAVLPLDRLVRTPSDILRRGPRPLPSNRVLVTGPSRTGDIEQIITLGVHGPTALEILVLTDAEISGAPAQG
jgi:L-lactate dehydrogenase complex protein LldG